MGVAKENRRNRDAQGRFRSSASRMCRARCGAWWWTGAGTIARGVRRGTGRECQRRRLCRHAGISGQFRGRTFVLAARRSGRAAGFSACAGIERYWNQSGADCTGSTARPGSPATRGGRCGTLCRRGGGSDRIMAPSTRARPDCKPEAGAGGGGFGCHAAAAADRGGTRAQCGPNPLERQRGPFLGTGGRSARQTSLHSRIVAPARPPRWRIVAPGMGS